MTSNEVKDKLMKELTEEMQSAVDYHQMAVDLKNQDCKECVFLYAIAKDEMTHAKWIHDYLEDSGMQIPKEVTAKYMELESAHKF